MVLLFEMDKNRCLLNSTLTKQDPMNATRFVKRDLQFKVKDHAAHPSLEDLHQGSHRDLVPANEGHKTAEDVLRRRKRRITEMFTTCTLVAATVEIPPEGNPSTSRRKMNTQASTMMDHLMRTISKWFLQVDLLQGLVHLPVLGVGVDVVNHGNLIFERFVSKCMPRMFDMS